jgi:O-antigen/teichoic acid export membrane protein
VTTVERTSDATLAATALAGPPALGARAKLAVLWATGFQFFRDIVQFGLTLALVRLLPADAYGQFGLLTTLLSFFTYYSFREFLGHTLQARDGEDVPYQDHFTAGAVIQGGIVVAVNLVALAFRWLPDYAPVSLVLHVMSLLFVIDLPAEFRTRMLERELDWRRLRLLQGIGFAAGGAVSLGMALAGLGVWALIIPTLFVPLPFVYDLFVRARWRPTWEFHWDRYRAAWRFGLTRMLTLTFFATAALTESLTLTSALGYAVLGVFGRALGLAQLLCGRLSSLLALAIYPVLTRVPRASDAFRRAGALYLRGVAWAVIPAAAIATLLADPIVRLIYGEQWLAAIPFVPWAMAGAALAAIAQTAYTVLLANGQQRECVVADAWRMVGVIGALVIALPAGPSRYLVALCFVHLVSLAIVTVFLGRAGVLSRPAWLEAVAPALVSGGVALAAAFSVQAALTETASPGAWSVAVTAPVFALVYLATLRMLFRAPLAEFVTQLPQSRALARALRLR